MRCSRFFCALGVYLSTLTSAPGLLHAAPSFAHYEDDVATFEANLLNHSFHEVPFALQHEEIEAAMKAFYSFLEEPGEVRTHIYGKLTAASRRSEFGYMKRESKNSHFDDKEFFHYHPQIWQEFGPWIEEHAAVKTFLLEADKVWMAARRAIELPLGLLEQRYPEISDQFLSEEKFVIRFLKYSPALVPDIKLAKSHFDCGAMTLAIGESTPGLRIGKSEENLVPVAHSSGKALFFLASTFQDQVKDSYFHPGWHDVVRTPESDRCVSRWAVVAFFEAPEVLPPSWESTHTVH
jgi:isopenicillin N synthase-like dioxygenase